MYFYLNRAAFKQKDPALIQLDAKMMEIHIANIMVAARFIIDREDTNEGMQQVLKKLSDMTVHYMSQKGLDTINL